MSKKAPRRRRRRANPFAPVALARRVLDEGACVARQGPEELFTFEGRHYLLHRGYGWVLRLKKRAAENTRRRLTGPELSAPPAAPRRPDPMPPGTLSPMLQRASASSAARNAAMTREIARLLRRQSS